MYVDDTMTLYGVGIIIIIIRQTTMHSYHLLLLPTRPLLGLAACV